MSEKAFVVSNEFEFPVVFLQNYCNDETLEGLGEAICQLCDDEKINIIFDLSRCKLINSLGMGELLDVVLTIDQDYEGFSVVTGLEKTQERMFKLTGIFPIAHLAPTVNDAITMLQSL